MEQVRGVNLGGWLVLERWITPALFEGVSGKDEHAFIEEQGIVEARRRLERHWATFITQQDIRRIQQLGLNTVRIPVGYWLFADTDGFLGGSYRYLDRLFSWAAQYGLKVILCLHGVPGSQNGNDHSGQTGGIGWYRFKHGRKTELVIRQLCARYGQHAALFGVELVNEPHIQGWWQRWRLLRYYRRAGRLVAAETHEGVQVIMSDAFQPKRLAPKIAALPVPRVSIDTHLYQLFSPADRALDFAGHIQKTAAWKQQLRELRAHAPVIVGEWSAAMDELYDPRSKTHARQYTKQQYTHFAVEQQRTFVAAGVGWCYWTARTEDGGVWSLLDHPEFLDIVTRD